MSAEEDKKQERARWKKWAKEAYELCTRIKFKNDDVLFQIDHIASTGYYPGETLKWLILQLERFERDQNETVEGCRCVCGEEPGINDPSWHNDGLFYVQCGRCGWVSPGDSTRLGAIKLWNQVMRPRPVAALIQNQDKTFGVLFPGFTSMSVLTDELDAALTRLEKRGYTVEDRTPGVRGTDSPARKRG